MRIKPLALCLGLCLTPGAYAEAEHEWDFAARLRYAMVESQWDGAAERDGEAVSGLLRLSLNSNWTESFSTFIEIDHVSTGLQDKHSDGVRLNGELSIVDVPGTEVNQAFFRVQTGSFDIRLGRQLIELDDQRFVGSNGFWQNDQTFDALDIKLSLLSESKLSYAYIANANRIFGDNSDRLITTDETDESYGTDGNNRSLGRLGDHEHNTHLVHFEYNEWDYSELKSYLYLMDIKDWPGNSNRTFGLSYNYEQKIDRLKYMVTIEGAVQNRQKINNSPTTFYSLVEFGIGLSSLEATLRYEELGSKDGVSFVTPLASFHDFQGWAGGPPRGATGIKDTSLKILWRKSPFKIDARYHKFSSAAGSVDLGTEFDVDFVYKIARKHRISLRLADYHGPTPNNGVAPDKFRAYLSYTYNL